MNKVCYILCRYLCIFNLVLVLAFIFAGPEIMVAWFGASALVSSLSMLYFRWAIKVSEERKTLLEELEND